MWPILIAAPILEELVSLGGDAVRAAIEAFAWKNRAEGAAVASVAWLVLILFGWLVMGRAKPGVKVAAVAAALLSVALSYLSFVRVGQILRSPHRPLLPIIRPEPRRPDPAPAPMPRPRFPRRTGDEPPEKETAQR
jgi:hypothetical protein